MIEDVSDVIEIQTCSLCVEVTQSDLAVDRVRSLCDSKRNRILSQDESDEKTSWVQ